jgi:hypothetical protein
VVGLRRESNYGGGNMAAEQEVIVDETVFGEEHIEPFDWEDYLYESWLEKCLEKEKRKATAAGL